MTDDHDGSYASDSYASDPYVNDASKGHHAAMQVPQMQAVRVEQAEPYQEPESEHHVG